MTLTKRISRLVLSSCLLSSVCSAQEFAVGRSDSVDTKIQLLQQALEEKDFDLARSLTDSIRDSVIHVQHEEQVPAESLIKTDEYGRVDDLPLVWKRWAEGWKYYKSFTVQETAGIARRGEPVELALSFPDDLTASLVRELRIATFDDLRMAEIPCQVLSEIRRGSTRHCKLLLLLDSPPNHQQSYIILFGNPDAELPDYPSDLTTKGSGYDLDISNAHFTASLSEQTGQLERLTLRREHGLELYSGGEGHGEPPGIDWAHDYVDEGRFQKLRISLWDECPDYEVITGPLCTIVRRWGFPHSPIHPVFTPSRLLVDVEYRFYSGLPWFHKIGSMRAVQDFTAEALRDDEWVFSGQPFTDTLWMDQFGKLQFGEVPAEEQDQIWGVGFYHRDTKDSFFAMFLDHSARGLAELKHNGAPLMYYRWHGHVWSRYPLPQKRIPAGAVLHQKNAYLLIPFTRGESEVTLELLRQSMINPLQIGSTQAPPTAVGLDVQSVKLARPGESGDASVSKAQIWSALEDCKDAQLYRADINVIDLGLIYDIRVRGGVVTVVMAVPHPGRARLGYFIDGSISVHPTLSVPIRQRLMSIWGVRQVVFEQLPSHTWNSNRLTDAGREKLGLPNAR